MSKTILFITDDSNEATSLQQLLDDAKVDRFEVKWAARLADGLDHVRNGKIDAILVDTFIAEGHGIEIFSRLYRLAPYIPMLAFCSQENEELARQAIQHGAKGYLVKHNLEGAKLPQILLAMIERAAMEEALFIEQERSAVTLNSISDAVLNIDINGKVTYLNTVAEYMTGWTGREAIGRPITEVLQLIDALTRTPIQSPLEQVLKQDRVMGLSANCLLLRRDGQECAIEDVAVPVRDRRGNVTGAVMVFHDISQAQAMTKKMSHLAQHDSLTDLPNRILLIDRLNHAIALAQRHHGKIAVLFLDLDGFKHVNDSFGHMTGDVLLQAVAKRLAACVRSSDTVSRQGGDEFVIMLADDGHEPDVILIAEKILAALAAPYNVEQLELQVSASIGIALYPTDGLDSETLIKHADIAMYHAKSSGRNCFQFFKDEMNVRAIERQSLEGNLRRALERQEFVLHYQPKVHLETGAITGVEALLRWQHPERGLMSASQFVPIAEECGLIVPIGKWVMREACRQSQAWIDAGLEPTAIAVNLSAREFREKGFLDSLSNILTETRLDPRLLEIELTENEMMRHGKSSAVVHATLKKMGVRLTVDDFGTGYSSLSSLKTFPIDTMKIHQSFVHDVTTDEENAAIVSAMIGMGSSLKHSVVAEGVETRGQLAFLRERRCEQGQGDYFSRPLRADECTVLLRTGISKALLA